MQIILQLFASVLFNFSQIVTWESECRNWYFATFEKFAIKVWDLTFLIVLCSIGLKFSIWNDIII